MLILYLKTNDRTEISVLPGKLYKQQLFLYGSDTVKKIEQYCTDYALLGVFTLSEEGLFIHTEGEGMVKWQMVKQGNYVMTLTDHTKFGTTCLFKVCSLSEIDMLITDKQLSAVLTQKLESNNVEIVLTE